MEQNQPSTDSIPNSKHPPNSSYEQLSSGFGYRGQQERESSSHDERDGPQTLFPWCSDRHGDSRAPLEHRAKQERGPGYDKRFPPVNLGEHSQGPPPANSEHRDQYEGQRERDQVRDYSSQYPLVEDRERVHDSNLAHRAPEHHDSYSPAEDRRPADYPDSHYLAAPGEREFEPTQRGSPLGPPFRESGPYERDHEYQREHEEPQYQRPGRPDRPALLPTPPQPPDYGGEYRYEELRVHEDRFDYQRSPRPAPDYDQPYHHLRPNDYGSRSSPERLSEHWIPEGRERFRDPAPQALTSQHHSPLANSSALEHLDTRLTEHERQDYGGPEDWAEPGARESDSGGFGSYRDGGEWGERDLDRARQNDYNQEGMYVHCRYVYTCAELKIRLWKFYWPSVQYDIQL